MERGRQLDNPGSANIHTGGTARPRVSAGQQLTSGATRPSSWKTCGSVFNPPATLLPARSDGGRRESDVKDVGRHTRARAPQDRCSPSYHRFIGARTLGAAASIGCRPSEPLLGPAVGETVSLTVGPGPSASPPSGRGPYPTRTLNEPTGCPGRGCPKVAMWCPGLGIPSHWSPVRGTPPPLSPAGRNLDLVVRTDPPPLGVLSPARRQLRR